MNPTKVAVFGGTGFLGRRVVRAFEKAGCEVRIVSRHPRNGGSGPYSLPVEGDVTDRASIERALGGMNAAVNCVSLYAESSEAGFDDVHVAGAGNVAEAAASAGIDRLVHLSGLGADPTSPSAYVSARGRGEIAVRDACPAATVLRPSVMFGPGDAFVSAIAGAVGKSPVFPLFGNGNVRLQPVHVADVASAVVASVHGETSGRETVGAGGPEVLTYREIVGRVKDWTGARSLLLPLPLAAWRLAAAVARFLPEPPVTEGQVALMKRDNMVPSGMRDLDDLGIRPRPMRRENAIGA